MSRFPHGVWGSTLASPDGVVKEWMLRDGLVMLQAKNASPQGEVLKARRRELMADSHSARWKDVWALFMEHGPALRRIGVALASQDHRLPADEITDLLHTFVLERLPRIALLTRGMASDEQGRYIRTSFRNFLRTFTRSYTQHEQSLKQLATEMQGPSEGFVQGLENERGSVGVFNQVSEGVEEKTFAEALPGLRPELAHAVAMFLGLEGQHRSIREIAKELGMTRYATRLAVLDGLLGVAILLGRRGILGGREVEACRLIVLEGRSLADAARALRLTQHQVRAALERARAIVAVAVGKR